MNVKSFALATAAAAIFVSGSALAEEPQGGDEAKIKCEGVNECKGQSACAGEANECSGKNSCKGKGFLKLTQAECDAAKAEGN